MLAKNPLKYRSETGAYRFAHWGCTSCDAFVAQSDKGAEFGDKKEPQSWS